MIVKQRSYFIRENNMLKRLNIDEIIALEIEGNYLKLWRRDDHCLVRATLDAALKLMPAGEFVQIHRSYAVAVRHIQAITRDSVLLRGDGINKEPPVSRKFYRGLVGSVTVIESGGK